jgi:Spy/CpxP family protein refolding chaperone
MRKLLLMCCFLIGFTAFARAQGGMRMSAEDRAKQLQTQLKLTDDQTAKVTAIYKAQRTKMDSIRTASNGDRDAMRSAMMPLMKSTNDQVKAVLTPDQATAYDKIQEERMQQMRQRMNGGGGGGN